MIQYIRIQNFRSVKDIALELGPLNIVFGPNGCGKSNIYNAIHLLTAAAEGRLSGFISEEGGLENMMWSGERSPLDRHPRRLQIACRTDSFDYELQIGFLKNCPIRRNSCSILSLKKRISGWPATPAGLPPAYCSARIRRRFSSMSPGRKVLSPRVFMKMSRCSVSLASRTVSRSIASAGDLAPLAVLS